MNINVKKIKLDGSVEIIPHPNQAELYNDKIDADFIESIKIHGIKQMPTLAKASDLGLTPPNALVIISGHRRIEAAKQAGLEYLYYDEKEYKNFFDSQVDHIVFNKQRIKTKKEIAAEIIGYKQKLDQIRKILAEQGIEGLTQFNSMDLSQHVKVDENGKHFLPLGSEMIEKDLGVTKKHQEQLNVIFNAEWLQDKVEKIHLSNRTAKEKTKLTEKFSKHVEAGRDSVDEKDGHSINTVHSEIIKAWNQIDSIINPKPKKKATKTKAKKATKDSPEMIAHKSEIAEGAEISELVLGDGYAVCIHNKMLYFSYDDQTYIVNTDVLLNQIKEL